MLTLDTINAMRAKFGLPPLKTAPVAKRKVKKRKYRRTGMSMFASPVINVSKYEPHQGAKEIARRAKQRKEV
jgi:hypothetical protein